jgi:hypothetical protein
MKSTLKLKSLKIKISMVEAWMKPERNWLFLIKDKYLYGGCLISTVYIHCK